MVENKPGSAGSHPVFGRKLQNRNYDTVLNLARGLLGWVAAKPGRKEEKALADRVYGNVSVDIYLNSLLKKLHTKVNALGVASDKQAKIKEELTTGVSKVTNEKLGHYEKFFATHAKNIPTNVQGNSMAVMEKPTAYSLKDKIVVLHDLMEYFGGDRPWVTDRTGKGLLDEPADDKWRATTAMSATGERTAYANSRGMGLTSSTREETDDTTKLARAENIPSGPVNQ